MPLIEVFSVASIGNSDQGIAPPVNLLSFCKKDYCKFPPLLWKGIEKFMTNNPILEYFTSAH
jgi:hypothetical protein